MIEKIPVGCGECLRCTSGGWCERPEDIRTHAKVIEIAEKLNEIIEHINSKQ